MKTGVDLVSQHFAVLASAREARHLAVHHEGQVAFRNAVGTQVAHEGVAVTVLEVAGRDDVALEARRRHEAEVAASRGRPHELSARGDRAGGLRAWSRALFTLLAWFLMVYLYNRINPKKPEPSGRVAYYIINVLMIPVVIALVIGAARGGYKHSTRPITISNAARYVETPRDVAIVLNTPFSFFRTFDKKALVKYSFFDNDKLVKLYNPHYIPAKVKPFSGENVVIIILESFAREYIGSMNHDLERGKYEGYTPFID